ncbi:hypothetical protein GOQ04_14825 [Emticicia sp. ODNR4P]|nr:hypothetical protein [Emticicia sp. ODNR4P]
MLFKNILQNGDVIGQFINKVSTTADVVRIAKLQGQIVAYVSNNASANFTILSRETLLAYIALTGSEANRVVLNGVVSETELQYVADSLGIQALSLTGAYNSTTLSRPLLATEITISGFVEGDLDPFLMQNPTFVAVLTLAVAATKVAKKRGYYNEVQTELASLKK